MSTRPRHFSPTIVVTPDITPQSPPIMQINDSELPIISTGDIAKPLINNSIEIDNTDDELDSISKRTINNLDNGKPKKLNKRKSTTKKTEESILTDTSGYLVDLFKFTDEEKSYDPSKDVFIQYSQIHNDELIKWYHLQLCPAKYYCSSKACPTHKGIWRRKPAYLLLHRRNGNNRDNRLTNLEYICPNCYFQEFGATLFTKKKQYLDKKIRKCANDCGRTLTSTYNSDYCYGCRKKIEKYDGETTISQLINITSYLNNNELDDAEKEEQAEILRTIYNTDIEVEANLRRNGISSNNIAGYSDISPSNRGQKAPSKSSHDNHKSIAPDIDTDMSGVLDDLSEPESI